MEPKDYKRPCSNEKCIIKEKNRTEIAPMICVTTQFGKTEFEYPRFICLKCATEFIDVKLLTALINGYTSSLALRTMMITTIKDSIKKSSRECKRSVKFIFRLKKKNPI